jgi:large subunit ribosomal protein L21
VNIFRAFGRGFSQWTDRQATLLPALTVWRMGRYNNGLSSASGGVMYAVIKTGGKQYRVAPGDTIRIERVKGDVGEQVKFGTVLAVYNDDKKVLAGSDAQAASVTGKIVSQGRAKKLTVLKFKKTNQYKIQRGHRQNYTAVQVSEIKL